MRYYLVAGERSGDLHGGNLIKQISRRDASASFRGFGGDDMRDAGMDLVVHYREMAFMGFAEFLQNITKSLRFLSQCKRDILAFKPEVVVLIDYGGFNRQVATFCKKQGVKVFYYIPPKVWAWRQSRAWQLKKNVDRMFVILPFEKQFYKKFDFDVDYVGNPVLDAVKAHQGDAKFLDKNGLSASTLIALLPGSRKQELKGIIPLIAEVVNRFPDLQFAVATVNNLDESLYAPLKAFQNVKFIYEDTYNLLQHARAAIVTSGTATLETALFRVPQIVVYKTNGFSFWLGKMVIQVQYISLVNLIAGREVVREMIQKDANSVSVGDELNALLNDLSHRNKMLEGYDEIIRVLDTGSASENAARLMTDYLKR